jgi:hypothetical protein
MMDETIGAGFVLRLTTIRISITIRLFTDRLGIPTTSEMIPPVSAEFIVERF